MENILLKALKDIVDLNIGATVEDTANERLKDLDIASKAIEQWEAGQNPLQPIVLQGPVDSGQGGLAPQKFTPEQENAIFGAVRWAFKQDNLKRAVDRDDFFEVLYSELNW